jgi:predicted dehydrogenase
MTIKVIQVGLGGMGNAWINTVQASDEVEYAGFVEISDSISETQAERYKLDTKRIFRSLPAALAALKSDGGVDGVIDVTPPQFHKEIALTALEAGIPVLAEKPLSGTLEDALEIVAAANKTGVLHMVAQNYRYSRQAQTIKRLLNSGEMGAVGAITISFFKGLLFDGFRAEMRYPLVVDMSIHHFDMLRFFTGSEPVSIYARSWNPPWSWIAGDSAAFVSLEMADQTRVSYNASWSATGQVTPWNANWRFDCANGVITLQDDQVWKQKFKGFDDSPGFPHIKNDPGTEVELVDIPHVAQAYLLHEFYEAITSGNPPATTCQDNIKSLTLIFDIIRSIESGGVIAPA